MMKFRIVTDEGKEILKSETYAGCENYWNACNGICEDENACGRPYKMATCTLMRQAERKRGKTI